MRGQRVALVIACVAVLALAAGVARAQSDGSVVGWGSMVVFEPSVLEDVTAVAAGWYHGLGLKGDGSIVAWGDNGVGQCDVPSPN
ncbi:hypothetical protein KAW64_11980, partial [bacterium]|nr:hypothetical protein [bacterium]